MRALGLDVGDRRIGVASGDTETALAVPLQSIERAPGDPAVIGEADVRAVLDLAAEREVDTIVVGLPISLNGRVGPQAVAVQGFVDALAERTSLKVVTVDERLSTVEAERRLREARGGRRARRTAKGAADSAAATIILQSWLDARRVW